MKSPKSQNAIELEHVSLRRGQKWILRDINWTLPRGACAAILGPNGSGKSTLARILACHVWPTGGESRVLGGAFGEVSLPDLRKQIRLVQPAGPYDIDPQLTAREVVLTGFFGTLALYDAPTDAMHAEAERILSQVGLSELADHPYPTLSSGERVRCLIGRALVQEPRLLLLDEPTAGLDLLAREQVMATLHGIAEKEADPPTMVIITHHVEELTPAVKHVLLLDNGEVTASGSPAQVLRPETLSAVYRCPVEVHESGGRFYLHVHPSTWDGLIRPRTVEQKRRKSG